MDYYKDFVAGLAVTSPEGPSFARMLRKLADNLDAQGDDALLKTVALDVDKPPPYGTWLLDVLLRRIQCADATLMGLACNLDTVRWDGVGRLLQLLFEQGVDPISRHYGSAMHGMLNELWCRKIADAGKQVAELVDPEDKAPPPKTLVDDTPSQDWGPEEWAAYLEVSELELPVVAVEPLLAGYRRIVEAEEWITTCVANGDSIEIARAQRSLEKRQKEWTWIATRAHALALRLQKSNGSPWEWPCKGARKAKLTAEVRAAIDEYRLSLKARPEPEEPPLNEHGERVFTPKGTAKLYGSDPDDDSIPTGADW